MQYPFPGMDPYLEQRALWEGVHARLIVAMANQLQPRLDPRYIASVEERVFLEGPERRIPDVGIQKIKGQPGPRPQPAFASDTAVIVEVEDQEIREARVEILDSANDMRLVALIEVVSPTNKRGGSRTGPSRRKPSLATATWSRSTSSGAGVTCSQSRNGGSGVSGGSIASVASRAGRIAIGSSFTRERSTSGCLV